MAPLIRLFIYAKAFRVRVILATICSVLNTCFDILPEVLIGIAVNVVVQGNHSWLAMLGISDVRTQLLLLGVLTFVIWSLESLFQYFYAVLWRNVAQSLQHQLRVDAYTHMQKLPMTFYEDKPTGALLSLLNDDINQLERFLDNGAHQFIYFATSTIVACAIFLYLSPILALFVLIPLPFVFFVTFFFQKKLSSRYMGVRERAADLASLLVNNITGIAVIKSYTTQDYEAGRLAQDSAQYRDASKSAIKLSAAFIPLVRMIIVIGFIFTIVLGGWQVLDGYLDVGSYSLLVFQTQRVLWPFTELAQMTDLYGRAMASTNRVLNLLSEPKEKVSGTRHLPLNEVKGRVELEHVSFSYPNGIEIFDNLSLTIEPATTVAFVGTTGSGKSTIIKLLLRFYDPTKGRILLDGIDITTINPNDVRRAIGLVSQDVFLFSGTVRENIVYGTFDASLDQIINAAKVAEAHEFIENLPDGYDTVIGERGIKLSGGQRQRLSIARAVLKDSPILIFDEATSAVDNETEVAIQHSLKKITADHTVIMIAHRLSTVREADNIFVVGQGGILESGTHEELIAQNGVYSYLWDVQTGEAD
ncbi:MAG TPA: ABC transporter ATP-binding protein [Candidatus Babeliales bacterium]|nr:ABC transporter ATP-binding protein [Candidatus Babeliales bacterium]